MVFVVPEGMLTDNLRWDNQGIFVVMRERDVLRRSDVHCMLYTVRCIQGWKKYLRHIISPDQGGVMSTLSRCIICD